MPENNNELMDATDCIKIWQQDQDDLLIVKPVLEVDTNNAYKKMVHLTEWHNILKAYFENIKATNKKGIKVGKDIAAFIDRTSEAFTFAGQRVEVSKILYCLVVDFYQYTGMGEIAGVVGLRQKVSGLIKKIEALNDPEINAETSLVLKNLTELDAKLGEALATLNDTYTKISNIVSQALDLQASLDVVPDETKGKTQMGLNRLLRQLADGFNTQDFSIDRVINFPNIRDEKLQKLITNWFKERPHFNKPYNEFVYGTGLWITDDVGKQKPNCEDAIAPSPSMPLEDDNYYISTEKLYKEAESQLEVATKDYTDKKKELDMLIAKLNGLKQAIDAAKSAKGC